MSAPSSFNPSSFPSYNPSGYSPPPNPSNFSVPGFNPSLSPSPPLPTSYRDPIPPAYTASLVGRTTPIPPPSVPNLSTPSFQPSFTPPSSSFSPAAAAPRPHIPSAPVVSPPSSFFNAHAPHARTAPSATPSLPSSWAAPLSQPPSLSPSSLQLTPPPTPTFNPAPSLPSTPNLANPYLIMSRPVGSATIPQPIDPASLRFPSSNPFISLPTPIFAVPSLPPSSLSGPAQWISSFPSFQATSAPRRITSWAPPSIERMPIPSNNALVRLPRSYSFSLQPQANFTFKVDAKTQQAYRRQFEQNLKMFYQLEAPPERPFSQLPAMHATQLVFQIDRHTTVFVNPATLTDFFQRASPAQKWALQAQFAQLTSRRESHNPHERSLSPMQKVNAFVLDALHNPRFQGSLQVLGGAAEVSAGLGITCGTGLIAAPIGHVVIVHGLDHVTTGFYCVITGKHKTTATQLALEAAGVSPEIASIGDAALSITGLGMGAKAVSRLVTYPQFKLPPPYLNDGYNCVASEEFKVMLRAKMEKPFVVNAELREHAEYLYRLDADIGSGSTAAAIREEIATGEMVGGKSHFQKGRDSITFLERWLRNNSTSSLGDRAAAENMIKDLKDALGLGE